MKRPILRPLLRSLPFCICLLPLLLTACAGERPDTLGLTNNMLAACPSSPNCVASQYAEDPDHYIAPLPLKSTLEQSQKRIQEIVVQLGGTIIVTDKTYMHVEFSSKVFGFVDDLEFHFTPQHIHVRSAARLGYYDFGVNSSRLEQIRQKYLQPR